MTMKQISTFLPEAILEAMEELIRRSIYPNRGEIIRDGVKRIIDDHGGVEYLVIGRQIGVQ